MSQLPILGWDQQLTLLQKLWRVDWPLLAVAAIIAIIGTATLYSVAGGSFQPLAERHAFRFVLGLGLVLVMTLITPRAWMALAYPFYGATLVLLALVPVLGVEALGARRWLTMAGFSVQPSELMKVALVAALARYYHWLPAERVSRPLWILLPMAMIAVPVVLTLRQPDLGTGMLFLLIGTAIMFLAGVSWLLFAAAGAASLIALPYVLEGLHGYQRKRIETFLDPDKDPLGAGYHISSPIQQQTEQFKLLVAQLQQLIPLVHLAAVQLHANIANDQFVGRRRGMLIQLDAAQQRLNARL